MKKFLLFVPLLLAGSLGCTVQQPSPAPRYPDRPYRPHRPEPCPRPHRQKVKLLFFTQPGCGPCREMERELNDSRLKIVLEDFELEEVRHPDRRFREYKVSSTPTLIAITSSGSKRYPGSNLERWLRDCKESEPITKISEGGRTAPDGQTELVVDLPASERKKNIASKGLGCCVFRSIEYAARWQNVPELYDLPEQMVKAGIEGGGYPEKVTKILKKFGPNVQYVQDTSGDAAVLEAILKSGRMPCVTYNGHDCHYSSSIAHMVCLPYFDRSAGLACVSDNNFIREDQFVWMSCDEFLQRWKGGGGSGWVVALLETPPPPVPHNKYN